MGSSSNVISVFESFAVVFYIYSMYAQLENKPVIYVGSYTEQRLSFSSLLLDTSIILSNFWGPLPNILDRKMVFLSDIVAHVIA